MNLAKITKAAFSLALVAALSACMHHHGQHGGGKGCCGMDDCKSMKCEQSMKCEKGEACEHGAKCDHAGKCDKSGGGDCSGNKSGCPFAGGASDGCTK